MAVLLLSGPSHQICFRSRIRGLCKQLQAPAKISKWLQVIWFLNLNTVFLMFGCLANSVIVFLQVGICAVYYVFISTHVQEIIEENTSFRASKTSWSLMIFLPVVIVNLLRSLKTIAILSMFGNIAMISSLIFIMQVCYSSNGGWLAASRW